MLSSLRSLARCSYILLSRRGVSAHTYTYKHCWFRIKWTSPRLRSWHTFTHPQGPPPLRIRELTGKSFFVFFCSFLRFSCFLSRFSVVFCVFLFFLVFCFRVVYYVFRGVILCFSRRFLRFVCFSRFSRFSCCFLCYSFYFPPIWLRGGIETFPGPPASPSTFRDQKCAPPWFTSYVFSSISGLRSVVLVPFPKFQLCAQCS